MNQNLNTLKNESKKSKESKRSKELDINPNLVNPIPIVKKKTKTKTNKKFCEKEETHIKVEEKYHLSFFTHQSLASTIEYLYSEKKLRPNFFEIQEKKKKIYEEKLKTFFNEIPKMVKKKFEDRADQIGINKIPMNNILRVDKIDELESSARKGQEFIDHLTSLNVDFTIELDKKKYYDNLIKTQKKRKMELESLKKHKKELKRKKKTLWEFWIKFFRLLNKVLNVHPKYKNRRIDAEGIEKLYGKTHIGRSMMLFTKSHNIQQSRSSSLLFDKFHNDIFSYLTPKLGYVKGGFVLLPTPRYIKNVYREYRKNNKNFTDIDIDKTNLQENYDKKVDWTPQLTHDNFEIIAHSQGYWDKINKRPWVYLRYVLNYYADNYDTYEHGIHIPMTVCADSIDQIFEFDEKTQKSKMNKIKQWHSNLLIAYISKKNRKNGIKRIDLYYYENNSKLVFYIKDTLNNLVQLVKTKFKEDKPDFTLNSTVQYMVPSNTDATHVKTTSTHAFWFTKHGICHQMSIMFGTIWGLLGSYFDNPVKLYLSFQGALSIEKEKSDNIKKNELISEFKGSVQHFLTLYYFHKNEMYDEVSDYYLTLKILWAHEKEKYKLKLNQFDITSPRRPRRLIKKIQNDRVIDIPRKPLLSTKDISSKSRDDTNKDNVIIKDISSKLPKSSIGGKKNKKIRKHRGIIQTGGNSGKLKKGYRYSGKRLKNGNAEIVKAKTIKRRQL